VQGYAGEEQLGEALKGADVIIIPAGVPRKPGMTRDDLFKVRPFSIPMHVSLLRVSVKEYFI
jgi:malate/lactate dehydrogenase